MITTCVLHSKTVVQRRGVETTVPTVIHTYITTWVTLTKAIE